MVPLHVTTKLIQLECRGMGGNNLSTYGIIKCKIVFKDAVNNKSITENTFDQRNKSKAIDLTETLKEIS